MVTVAILGMGARGGQVYSAFAHIKPDLMKITAICDIKKEIVEKYKKEFNLNDAQCFYEAEEIFNSPKLADVMIIATQDKDHYAHAMKALQKGYHLILEKPISPSAAMCVDIEREAKKQGRLVAVCHVLRYTTFFRELKKLLDKKELGEIRGIEQTENVAYWHYAHSFIRGNWSDSLKTSPMILQKCCHDMDIIQWLVGAKPTRVTSMGELKYFKRENAPEGSTERCALSCAVKDTCPYNAERFYLKRYETMSEEDRNKDWMYNVVCDNQPTYARMKEAMEKSDYGKCVFRSDNNVVDHEVTTIKFENDVIASLTMSAFTKDCHRQLQIFCANGEIVADDLSFVINVKPFFGKNYDIDTAKLTDDLSGHGGGDNKMLEEFLTAIEKGAKDISTSLEQSVLSHIMAFAAEESRLKGGAPIEISKFANYVKEGEDDGNNYDKKQKQD